jgi:hypothetical protein
MGLVSEAEIKSNDFVAFNVGQDEDCVGLSGLRQQIDTSQWIVLPSTRAQTTQEESSFPKVWDQRFSCI